MAGYKVKITLKDTKPPVWRKVMLPEHITFEELHHVIQMLFGWKDYHLHAFTFSDNDIEVVHGYEDAMGNAYLEHKTLVDELR